MTIHEPCRCDPPESGEEHCNGGCLLRAELAAAERRVAELEEQLNVAERASAAWESNYNTLNGEISAGQRLADVRSAATDVLADTAGETERTFDAAFHKACLLTGTLQFIVAHSDLVVPADGQDLLSRLAAAARENERLGRFEALVKATRYVLKDHDCDAMPYHDGCLACALEDDIAAALAAEPRETKGDDP